MIIRTGRFSGTSLRGGGNFGVVTAMRHRVHDPPGVRSGMLLFPFSEAKAVLEGCVDITASAAEELTVQLGFVGGPDGAAAVMVVPTWSGLPEHGEALVAPFFQLGTLHAKYFDARGCRRLLSGGAG
jgi:FAD/FMN-containing dehydrogenase